MSNYKYEVVWMDEHMTIFTVRYLDKKKAKAWYNVLKNLEQVGEKISRIKLLAYRPY